MIQDDFGNLVDVATAGSLRERLDAGDKRMGRIEDELAANTRMTEALAHNTAEIVEFFQAMRGALKVLNWLGRLAKPLSALAALAASLMAVWAAVKGGK